MGYDIVKHLYDEIMSERPTPETDAIELGMFGQDAKLIADFARRLERERDEARDAAEKAKAFKRVMKEGNAKLRRELEELNKRLIEVCQYGVVCTIEREDLRKEVATERALADRLADSLTACERWVNQPCDVKTEADKALMEWKEARNGPER